MDFSSTFLYQREKCKIVKTMHIGKHIKEIMEQKQKGATWLAKALPCERSNVYYIYKRPSIDTSLLQKISTLLEYDFFSDLSKETFAKKTDSSA